MRTIAETSLRERECALLERFVVELRERLGDELHAVWLYGSRARGEPPAHEDSDVDLIVLVEDASREGEGRVREALREAERQLDDHRTANWFSLHVHDLEWLSGRRAIKDFYIAEVDRDKVVLAGGGISWANGSDHHEGDVSQRSAEYMAAAREWLAGAEAALEHSPATALSSAYYAMFYAARGALSEKDTYAKTHDGVWNRFYLTFAESGEFDEALAQAARKTQQKREDATYEAWMAPREDAVDTIDLARSFLAAVDALVP